MYKDKRNHKFFDKISHFFDERIKIGDERIMTVKSLYGNLGRTAKNSARVYSQEKQHF